MRELDDVGGGGNRCVLGVVGQDVVLDLVVQAEAEFAVGALARLILHDLMMRPGVVA